MNSHTPGPWEVISELRDTDEIICDMMNSGYVAVTQGQKLSNWRDDARLIAASPDLLEAAELYLKFRHDADCGLGYRFSGKHPATQLKEAIAKAKGLTSS